MVKGWNDWGRIKFQRIYGAGEKRMAKSGISGIQKETGEQREKGDEEWTG